MINNQQGQILVIVFAALGVVLFTVIFIIAGAQVYYQNAAYSQDAEKAIALAEAGVDKALNSLNKTGGSYGGESETAVGDGSYSVTITTKDAGTKIVESTGYIPSKAKAKVRRKITIQASKGVGVSFVYGVQVGEGGLELGNNNLIKGSIYSNGSIRAGNNNQVIGDAWVAGGAQPDPNQQTDCTASNCLDFIFGTQVSGQSQLDVAQSFQVSSSTTLAKVSLKLKKIGNPADVTVRVLKDASGNPDKNQVLATGALFSNLVSTSYGWIDVTFDSTPNLTANTAYWVMIDASSNNTNYWSWQNDLAQSYNRGLPKWSQDWSAGNPSWNDISGDLSFKVYLGGAPTSISANSDFRISKDTQGKGGDVHANRIVKLTIQGDAYYQTITESTVAGQSFPGSADPIPKIMPISESNILDWKDQADNVVSVGDITSCPATLDSKKIVGNVSLGNNCTVVVKTPIWITGKLALGNDNTFKLAPEFGASSGVIVVDGTVAFGNNNHLEGTGTGDSLLMVLSNYDSRTTGLDAIEVGNNGNTGVLYANTGIIDPGNNNNFTELTAWKISLTNNSVLNYKSGLSSTLFQSGPSGTFSLVKGTYQVK